MDAQQLKTVKRKNKIRGSKTDYVYYAICGFILFLLAVIVIYPLYYIVIASISDPDAVMTGDEADAVVQCGLLLVSLHLSTYLPKLNL